jgi:3-oxoacyl-[acyl-carrier-protein] synthase II
MSQPKVVVTGLGAVTSLGLNVKDSWNNLVNGMAGIGPITLFDATDSLTKIAAQVPRDFGELARLNIKKINRNKMTRVGEFAVVAAREAVIDAALLDQFHPEKTGVIVGATGSGYNSLEAEREGDYIVRSMINSLSAWISLEYKLKGANFTVNTACASSAFALALAFDRIRSGQEEVVIAGGTDSMISKEGIAGFNEILAMSENNAAGPTASRPFDKNRDGFVMGEGAGICLLESYESAVRRKARIYCEFAGYGMTSESYNITAPEKNGQGMARTMELALKNSGLRPEEVNYINAHGTSTHLNDIYETKAIKSVFGNAAYGIPISSTKSMIGHTLGAAGAIEALITVKSVAEDIITPTINYTEIDPECDLDYVPNKARKQVVNVALSNSFGFGGHNCTLVFKKL